MDIISEIFISVEIWRYKRIKFYGEILVLHAGYTLDDPVFTKSAKSSSYKFLLQQLIIYDMLTV